MQRYFFNVHDQNGSLIDPEGTVCADLDAARRTAIHSVRSILAEDLVQGCIDMNGMVDVLDAGGGLIESIAFAECVILIPEGRQRVSSRSSA
ncbi:hypothetical protein CA234_22745 [Sphingomonas sp. ABOLE]|uniref:DUF6894 family protein n=1 Tax=Sphingomonas sp. ABOLE TaxID=1985878 RepID=UPI000F7D813A|nr:hypothetical protein [Sphingomonas sp. ABOLE]RSV33277.1 hypothetical protein CA234_22745 [Sphingomonas sp. ABOLE]